MAKLIKPKNRLKEKVGDGGFSERKIEAAQNYIDDNDIDFKPIAQSLLNKLIEASAQPNENPNTNKEILAEIMDPLMQLVAQGSFFHYPSITAISEVLVDFLDTVETLNDDVLEIINAYIKAIKVLLAMEIRANTAQACTELVDELDKACKRYISKIDDNI